MGGYGWGTVEENELVRAVDIALDLGVRLFDTADIYGFGKSETVLGRALGSRRDRAIIATKFGVRSQNGQQFYDTSVGWINTAVEGSLRRLGVECIDLYQMHYWDKRTPLGEIIPALQSLMTAGKIRAYGITNYDPCDPALGGHDTEIASYSFQYSLVHREHESTIAAMQRQTDPVFLSWGSLGQGILSGKYRSLGLLDSSDRRQRDVYTNFHGAKFDVIQQTLAEMREIAAEVGNCSLSQLALRWIIDHFPRAVPLVGIKRPVQIIDAAAVFNLKLDNSVCARLDRLTAQFGPSSISS